MKLKKSTFRLLKLAEIYRCAAIIDDIKHQCPDFKNFDVGSLLGKGQQGEVYNYMGSVLKLQKVNSEEVADEKINELLKLRYLNLDLYPEIYDVQKLCPIVDENGNEYYIYAYTMEKLDPFEEASEVSRIIKDIQMGKGERNSHSDYYSEASSLANKLENSGTIHVDINPGAIMQNREGELKLVDLDSVITF
jgi:serine/threonine protein kinase